jgi:hypothetical protein
LVTTLVAIGGNAVMPIPPIKRQLGLLWLNNSGSLRWFAVPHPASVVFTADLRIAVFVGTID